VELIAAGFLLGDVELAHRPLHRKRVASRR